MTETNLMKFTLFSQSKDDDTKKILEELEEERWGLLSLLGTLKKLYGSEGKLFPSNIEQLNKDIASSYNSTPLSNALPYYAQLNNSNDINSDQMHVKSHFDSGMTYPQLKKAVEGEKAHIENKIDKICFLQMLDNIENHCAEYIKQGDNVNTNSLQVISNFKSDISAAKAEVKDSDSLNSKHVQDVRDIITKYEDKDAIKELQRCQGFSFKRVFAAIVNKLFGGSSEDNYNVIKTDGEKTLLNAKKELAHTNQRLCSI